MEAMRCEVQLEIPLNHSEIVPITQMCHKELDLGNASLSLRSASLSLRIRLLQS